MMHPYRKPARARAEHEPEPASDDDERVIARLMIALGGLRVVVAVASAETFGAEPSIALLMLVLGLVFLVRRR